MHNVLWLDDEFMDEDMIQFAIEAKNKYGLILKGFQSYEEGFEELEKNLKKYDAILLDGLFYETKGQAKGTEDNIAIGSAIAKINELRNQKVFTWFVFSGKRSFTKEENSLLAANKAHCYDKKNIDDATRLLLDIKNAAISQPDAQLKYDYRKLFLLCTHPYLGEDNFSRLFSIIKHIENRERLSNTEDLLNPLRKIVERIFEKLRDIGIIPDQILTNKGWINGCGHFISNNHSDFEQIEQIFPPIIGENFNRLLSITHDASHVGGTLKLKADQYLQAANSDYLYRSCVYLLFDILLWFMDFMINNPDKDRNTERWKWKESNGDWISGSITKIAENGWGTFRPDNTSTTLSIPPQMVQENVLSENEKISVITEPSPDRTKTFIKKISKTR